MKTYVHTHACAWIFIAALFKIAKCGNKCPSTDESINKLWHFHTGKCDPAIKRNAILIHVTTWMNLVNMPSERSQSQKTTYYTKCPDGGNSGLVVREGPVTSERRPEYWEAAAASEGGAAFYQREQLAWGPRKGWGRCVWGPERRLGWPYALGVILSPIVL